MVSSMLWRIDFPELLGQAIKASYVPDLTPLRCRSWTSVRITSSMSEMSALTSPEGLFQFSVENAYRVRVLDTGALEGFYRTPNVFGARSVPVSPRHAAQRRPSAVAVHYDGDVPRSTFR